MTAKFKDQFDDGFCFSFLGQSEPFLKKGVDLLYKFRGIPLDELISLDGKKLDRLLMNESSFPIVVNYVFDEFLSLKNKNICIKNSKIHLFLYTLCKLDDVVLFLVWQISTEICNETQTEWEQRYGLLPNSCCESHTVSALNKKEQSRRESEFRVSSTKLKAMKESRLKKLKDEKICPDQTEKILKEIETLEYSLELLEEFAQKEKEASQSVCLKDGNLKSDEDCDYKTPYIKCTPIVFSHVFNYKGSQTKEDFKNLSFNVPINKDFELSSFGEKILFCYGQSQNPTSVLCSSLYDSLILEKTGSEVKEHNFKNFLTDSFQTCWNYQNEIVRTDSKKAAEIKEHYLLGLSLYI